MTVKLVWATPNADEVMGYCARVSNPANQDNPDVGKLLRYCSKHGHWSVFEMASMCVEINTTRDIGRQILRHRSFHFQEFSQRYAALSTLPAAPLRECRLQDAKNRQNSLENADAYLAEWWEGAQKRVLIDAEYLYDKALKLGIAKEQARAILPEGLTMSRMYMGGTIRDWMHYLRVRTDLDTQKEHRLIAEQCLAVLRTVAPITANTHFLEPTA